MLSSVSCVVCQPTSQPNVNVVIFRWVFGGSSRRIQLPSNPVYGQARRQVKSCSVSANIFQLATACRQQDFSQSKREKKKKNIHRSKSKSSSSSSRSNNNKKFQPLCWLPLNESALCCGRCRWHNESARNERKSQWNLHVRLDFFFLPPTITSVNLNWDAIQAN